MTVSEAAKEKGLDTFDTSLPQGWVDKVMGAMPDNMVPYGNIVWCYRWDEVGFSDSWGRPVGVTPEGEFILSHLAAMYMP